MKVLLINPPWVHKAVYPPLGLAYIASWLDLHDIDNEIIECEVLGLSLNDVREIILEKKPEVVGLTATTPSVESAFKCARAIKEVAPETTVVLGGAHATSLPEQCVKKDEIDIAVVGEGEITFLELVKALRDGTPLESVNGICFKNEKGEIVRTKPRALIQNLDEIPFPARHKLPMDKYIGNPGLPKVGNTGTIMTTRGCPFQCVYCSSRVIWGRKVRKRSAKNVLDELEHLVKEFDVKSVMFKDDIFTIDKKRAVEICRGIRERNLDIIWSCSSRVNTISKELVREMKLAGCRYIEFGIETGSERMLKVLKKGATLEQARNAVRWCKEEGIEINTFLMIGNPGETEEEIMKTFEFAKELDPDNAQVAITTPFPGSELYENIKSEIGEVKNWDVFLHVNPLYPSKGTPAVLLSKVPPETLHEYNKKMTRYFALKPKRIIRNLTKIRSFKELKRQINAGIELLKP